MKDRNKTQYQNPTHGSLNYLHDPSWLDDHAPKRPQEVKSAGFQANRFAKLAGYDIEKRQAIIQRDEEEDPNIGIIDPLYFRWRLHEWNTLPNELGVPAGEGIENQLVNLPAEEYDSPDPDANDDKKKEDAEEEPTGRVRPWSKCFHLGAIVDGKHLIGSRLNRSSPWTRYEDYRTGKLHQAFRVSETLIPEGQYSKDEIEEYSNGLTDAARTPGVISPGTSVGGIVSPDPPGEDVKIDQFNPEDWPNDRIHILINDRMNQEGGYVWSGGTPHLNVGKHYDTKLNVVPGLFAQWGDAFVLTEDDVYTRTGRDSEARSLLNLWHDVHFHMSEAKDGRIYFTVNPPGAEPFGKRIKGEMIGDPGVANTNTQWGQESVNWRPQIKLPIEYGLPWTDPGPEPIPFPDDWPDGLPLPGPIGPLGPGPIAGPIGVPGPYGPWVNDWPHDVDKQVQRQGIILPHPGTDETICPMQFYISAFTRVPPGEIVAPANAVFRYIAHIYHDSGSGGDYLQFPTFEISGRWDIPVTADENYIFHTDWSGAIDARQLKPGDNIIYYYWRDRTDPDDTADYSVYIKEMLPLTGPPVDVGCLWSIFSDDDTVSFNGAEVYLESVPPI